MAAGNRSGHSAGAGTSAGKSAGKSAGTSAGTSVGPGAGKSAGRAEPGPRKVSRSRKVPEVVKKAAPAETRRPRGRNEDKRGRSGPDPREEHNDGPKFVGGPRSSFGTRVARRVTCARCGTAEHVPYVPKDPARALCRACAAEVLKTYEAGVRVRTPTRKTACNLCGAPFDLPVTVEDDGDPLCPSCLRGFTAWQGSVDTPYEERTQAVVEERLSGALLRKRKS